MIYKEKPQARIREICRRLLNSCPNPKTELSYISHYTFLVAVVLSAQSTDVQVNKVTTELFKKYRTIDDILKLGLSGLQENIKSIGLYKNKANNIIALSEILKEKYSGAVPRNREDLEKLPGVGRKTANVVLNSLFGESVIAVDTHVFRVSRRLGLSDGSNPHKVEKDLEKIIPAKYKKYIGNLLVLHGRYVCKAKKPNCGKCVLNDLCKSEDNYVRQGCEPKYC